MMGTPAFAAGLLAALLATARSTARAADLSVRKTGPGEYQVEASFGTSAARSRVWTVLTDYDDMPRFVRSIRVSRARRDGNELLVEQESIGRFFVFSHTIHLRLVVQEDPPRSIRFHDVSARCFDRYDGSWTIEGGAPDLTVRYRLAVKEGAGLPEYVPRSAVEASARSMLADLEREMERPGPATAP